MRYKPGTKLIVVHAPPGVWSMGGPSVYFDNEETGEFSLESVAKNYEKDGWEITYGIVTEREDS